MGFFVKTQVSHSQFGFSAPYDPAPKSNLTFPQDADKKRFLLAYAIDGVL
jgi:hypothetical protein